MLTAQTIIIMKKIRDKFKIRDCMTRRKIKQYL